MGIIISNNSNSINSDSHNSEEAIDTREERNKNDRSRTIYRCPKCRSINPPDAKYCFHCGKVFKSKE